MSIEKTLCQFGIYDDSESEKNVIATLAKLADAYFNGEPLVSDEEFDELYKFAKDNWPENGYFRQVGSKVRGAEIKHNMPVAGLKQLYTVEEVQSWAKGGGLGVASSKLDGSSATITYVNGNLHSAATRGDGIYGKDITRHILNFPGVPIGIPRVETLDIRGELIISKDNFPKVQELLLKLKGREYKNARNTIVGLINGKEIPEEVFQYLEFVAYDIAGSVDNKDNQFLELETLGFTTPEWWGGIEIDTLNEEFLSMLMKELKDDSGYDCDGIVIELWSGKRRKDLMPTEDDLNPGYAFKWKPNAEEAMRTSKCIGVEWNISKDGYLKPVVLIEPVDLGGVTIKRLSGFNMAFITDNMISTGATIKFCRSGDVIPHIVDVVEKATALDLPSVEWEWNETNVDAVTVNETVEAHLLKVKSFFNALEVDNLQEASIEKLMAAGYDSIEDILEIGLKSNPEEVWQECMGKNGLKAYDSLKSKLSDVALSDLMGAWPYFGRGFGKRKAKALLDGIGDFRTVTLEEIVKVDGFSDKSAVMFLSGRERFLEFLDTYSGKFDIISLSKVKEQSEGPLSGMSFAFTGFRLKDLEPVIESLGGIIHDGVKNDSTFLIAKDPNAKSSKLEKARKLGITILSLSELKIKLEIK